MTTPGERSPDRRRQILEEATHLFAAKGFDGASMRNIAQACGISEAAIYRHFAGKMDLYEQVITAKAAEHDIPGKLSDIPGGLDLEQVLRAVAEGILALGAADPGLMRLMISNSLEQGSSVARVLYREVRLPFIDFLSAELARRIGTGGIREIDPLITSRCFVGMVMDCALNVSIFNQVSGMDLETRDVVSNNVPIFALGLRKQGPSEDPDGRDGGR